MIRFLLFVCVIASGCADAAESLGVGVEHQSQINQCRIDPETETCTCDGSPIVVDLAGDGIHLTGSDNGVMFSLRGGQPWLWSWTAAGSDDAWLALDLDGNGTIDSGAELFGDNTLQAVSSSPNGFLALAFYDAIAQGGNHDGKIDSHDRVWSQLRLWQDNNHDGVSQPEELIGLDKAHVHSMSLAYQPTSIVDAHGNAFLFRGTIVADLPVSATIYDVWLQGSQPVAASPGTGSGATTNSTTYYSCRAWGYSAKFSGQAPPNDLIACVQAAYDGLQVPSYLHSSTYTDANFWSSTVIGSTAATGCATAMQTVYNLIAPGCGVFDHGILDPNGLAPYSGVMQGSQGQVRCSCSTFVVQDPGGGGGGC